MGGDGVREEGIRRYLAPRLWELSMAPVLAYSDPSPSTLTKLDLLLLGAKNMPAASQGRYGQGILSAVKGGVYCARAGPA